MDFKTFFLKVFPDKDDEKHTKMIDNLKDLGFDSVTDLQYFDKQAAEDLESFTRIDINKLKDNYLKFKNENFINCLSAVFNGFPEERLKEIESFLNDQSIFTNADLLSANTNKLKKCKFLSDNEILKIEKFIEEKNAVHYIKIMDEKHLELASALNEIFIGEPDERMPEIEEILKKHGITARKDIMHVDTIKLRKEQLLRDAEVAKIEFYLETNHKEQYDKIKERKELERYNPENLDHVVNNVFSGTHAKRLEEIKKILNNEEIYNGVDILVVDTNKLRENRLPLSEVEILKIEEYIRKKNPVRYEEIRAAKLRKDELTLMELKKKKEIELFSLKEKEELKILELKLKQNMELKALEMMANVEQQHLENKEMEEKRKQENIRLQRKEDAKIKLAKIESERIANKYYIQSKIDEKKELQMQVLRFEQECIKINKTIAGIEAGWSYIGMAADLGTAKIDLKKTTELLEEKKGKLDEVERQLQKFDRS